MSDVAVAPERPSVASARATSGGRPLRRRSGLPSGRAVVGGFLVAVSALGVFAAYARATQAPQTTYVVARGDIPVGTRLTGDLLTRLPMTLPDVVAERATFSDERTLIGAVTVGPIRRGELVQAGDVVKKRSAPGELEISFAIDTSRAVGGTLRPGERVDVLATFGGGGDTYTVAVVRQARVLDSSRDTGALAGGDSEVLTLAVASSEEALALTHAVNAGEVTLVRSTGVTATGPVGQTYLAPAAERPTTADADRRDG
jgi:pilus assembly protein CpaB